MMNYWQVAAGDGPRDYSQVFLRFGSMLIGPGDPGDYHENSDYYKDPKLVSKSDITAIRSFVQYVKEGDVVVLKKPYKKLFEVLAVGTVVGGYSHVSAFDDVEGWDLQHRRGVKWVKPDQVCRIKGLTRGTFKRINHQTAIAKVNEILQSGTPIPSEANPKDSGKLEDEELIEILINNGLRPNDAEDFTHTLRYIRRLVKWYQYNGKNVKEHETRTFLIIPLILALGWPEQQLKIEWNNIDVAFFDRPYSKGDTSTPNDCIIILESKRLREGLSYATKQGQFYASKYPKCERLIVSDCCCYKLYKRKGKDWVYSAYLNILKPRRKHPYEPDVGGAPDVFLSLMGK
jgi:hypothetical protein